MDANEREVYRAAIHGDRDAFEMIIRTQSRALSPSLTAFCKTARKPKTRCRTRSSKPGNRAGACAIRRNFLPGWPRSHDTAPATFFANAAPFRFPTKYGTAVAPETTETTSLDRQLHSALAALPELHRSALTLRYFEEMDYQSIEKLLGLSNGALRGILGRALASMRKQLKPALASLE